MHTPDTTAAKIAVFKECGIENAVTPSDMAGHDSDEAHARYTHLAFTKQTEALAKLSSIGGWR